MTTPRIYVFCNSGDCRRPGCDWHTMLAIAEDGHCLASHVCSHHAYAAHDMGIDENGWERDKYAAHYPDGFEVVWVENPETDPDLSAAYAKNQALREASAPSSGGEGES